MKKILTLVAVTSIALTATASYKDYSDWGKLKLVGNQLSDKDGNPVQLKGWSTFSLHYKGYCGGEGQWKLMKNYGANIVRLAMYIDDPNDGGSYLARPDYFKSLIKQSIDETKSLNMYCLVDWHILQQSNGGSGDPNKNKDAAKEFFAEISKYCADNGYDHVLYELCNEPTCGWSGIKSYAEEVIPVIIANQSDAIIVVGTDQWCQKIMEPVSNPISSKYKKNVMYSFHYYACSHYSLLGDFRNAQKNLPVFVSEWSAVKFDGDGPFCAQNADEMLSACENINYAPQLVSWCLWNWGSKREASSFFQDNCSVSNLSLYSDNSGKKYSDYVINIMGDGVVPPSPCECGVWIDINQIPSTTTSAWHWDYYDLGGEGVAYHDGNGGAWEKDEDGVVLDYKKTGEEVDVFSLAKKMQWLDKECPWSTVKDGKVVEWDPSINTTWKDEDGNPTYKSLNGGRTYSGTDGSARPDEGVDLSGAGLNGTGIGGYYCNLGWVEEDEWINYTVKVTEPGYYKISAAVGAEYGAPSKTGEISITSAHGNHLRGTSVVYDNEAVTTFGFPKTTKCADTTVDREKEPWNCWAVSDAKSGRNSEVLCAFGEAGEQSITIRFSGNAGGVGPLIFEWYGNLDPLDPITAVTDVEADAVDFSVYPNPTTGEFTITLAENDEATVEVVNMAGQVVASQNIEGSATIKKALAAGVYTVVVKSNGAVSTQKLVVK
ncbi:MAG: cellulase family glycosylhydrolase [Paludibacteraceae bacterium]|nr:cellulase family glycosylhydrolase [Paludibacteraceae bacterium]